jgi:predicted nucleic acid-binding protein
MIFLETSFLVAFFVKKDEHYKRALEVMKALKDKEKIISEMIIYETLTVLRKVKQSDKQLARAYKSLTKLKVLEDKEYYTDSLKYTLHKNDIGFFDNLSYIVMKNNDIKEIASFDPDFDIFDDIERVY